MDSMPTPVFISWSGDYAKDVANSLKDFLEEAIQACDTFVSDQDIDAGDRWAEEIRKRLNESVAGIICLTKDRLDARWINYEAGAMATTRRVIPYCVDLDPSQVGLPLNQLQLVRADRIGTRRMLRALNDAVTDGKRTDKQLDTSMDAWWPRLEASLDAARRAEEARTGLEVKEPEPTVDQRLGSIEDALRGLTTKIEEAWSAMDEQHVPKSWAVRNLREQHAPAGPRGLMALLKEARAKADQEVAPDLDVIAEIVAERVGISRGESGSVDVSMINLDTVIQLAEDVLTEVKHGMVKTRSDVIRMADHQVATTYRSRLGLPEQ